MITNLLFDPDVTLTDPKKGLEAKRGFVKYRSRFRQH